MYRTIVYIFNKFRLWRRKNSKSTKQRKLIRASGLFDAKWYLAQNPDLSLGRLSPIDHYIEIGWREGRSPSATFDAAWYLTAYVDVRAAGVEPLLHYLTYGAREGRSANAAGAKLYKAPQVGDEVISAVTSGDLRDLPDAARGAIEDASPDGRGAGSVRALLLDPTVRFVADECKGRDVIEIGFRDTSTIELAVACIAQGAASFRILHHDRPIDVTRRLRRVAKRVGAERPVSLFLEGYASNDSGDFWQPYWTETVGRDWVICSSLSERDIRNKLGSVDISVSIDNVFLTDDIVRTLRRLAHISEDSIIFNTSLVEPFDIEVAGETISFRSTDVWYAGAMAAAQISAMDIYWKDRGVELAQFQRFPDGLSRKRAAQMAIPSVWWWFLGRDGLDAILELARLRRVKTRTIWGGRAIIVMARKIEHELGRKFE